MNIFISYQFDLDRTYKEELSSWLKALGHRNYSLSYQHRDDDTVWNEIYKRSWVCSVIIVLIGPRTARSTWIARELQECLQFDDRFSAQTSRRVRKPKALLAIELPGGPYGIPDRVQDRLNEQTALRVNWSDLTRTRDLNAILEQALQLRPA